MIKINEKTRRVSPIGVVNVKSDLKAHRLRFICKDQVTENVKLSECSLWINYTNGGIYDRYAVEDLVVNGDNVTFSWLLGGNATAYNGETQFTILAEQTENGEISLAWNTVLASFKVEDAIEAELTPRESQQDVFEQLLQMVGGKQDKLTAGNNITIENNVISATGGGSVAFDDTITQNQRTGKYGIDFTSWVVDEHSLDPVLPLEPEDNNKAVDAIDIAAAVNALGAVLNRLKQDKLVLDEGLKWFGVSDKLLQLDYAQYDQQTQSYDANKPIKGSTYTEGLNGKQDTITVDNTLTKSAANQLSVHFGNFDSQTGSYDSGMPASLDAIEAGCTYLWNSEIAPTFGNYYTRTMTDTLLAGKQPRGDYATNTALTNGLALKADTSTTYTKTEVDTALTGKQDARTEVNITDSTLTALTLAKDTDYVFKTLVGTMALSLASAFNSGRSTLTFTTGDTPNVTLDSDDMPEKWHGEEITTFEANTTYELDLRVVELPVKNETTNEVELTPTLIIAGGAVTEAI